MPDETWSIRKVLKWMGEDFSKLGLSDARLDAELLVAHALNLDRVHLYMDLDRPLGAQELSAIRALVKRRRAFEPVAYILGHKEFYGRRFEVSPDVLIPRPETELLVERCLEWIDARAGSGDVKVLELCTGSGALAVSVATERPQVEVLATDISECALRCAQSNASAHHVQERLTFLRSDVFEEVDGTGFDVLMANPPYIAEPDWPTLAKDITQHEPRVALCAGADGLDVLRRIITDAPAFLHSGASMLLEFGQGQAEALKALAAEAGFKDIAVHRDLAGIERVLQAAMP